MHAVDTNVVVRLLVQDDVKQTQAAQAFVAGGAWISHIALVEATWVLSAVYGRTPQQIGAALAQLLEHESVVVQDADVVALALSHLRKKPALGFSDLPHPRGRPEGGPPAARDVRPRPRVPRRGGPAHGVKSGHSWHPLHGRRRAFVEQLLNNQIWNTRSLRNGAARRRISFGSPVAMTARSNVSAVATTNASIAWADDSLALASRCPATRATCGVMSQTKMPRALRRWLIGASLSVARQTSASTAAGMRMSAWFA